MTRTRRTFLFYSAGVPIAMAMAAWTFFPRVDYGTLRPLDGQSSNFPAKNQQDSQAKGFQLSRANQKNSSSTLAAISSALVQATEKREKRSTALSADASVRRYFVQKGDTLAAIWTKLGASHPRALEAAAALKSAGSSASSLQVNEELQFQFDSDGEISSMKRRLGNGALVSLSITNGTYRAVLTQPQIREVERTVSGVINTSFSASAHDVNLPYEVVDEMVDLLSSRLEFRRELHRGDSFSVIYKERRAEDGSLVAPGSIIAASIRSTSPRTGEPRLVAAIRDSRETNSRYFNEEGQPLGDYFLRYPLTFSRISSVFSTSRFHPVLKHARPHNGVDFAAPIGTPVRAIADGVVQVAGASGEAGNMVKISHGSRYSTAYLHLSKISSAVKQGTRVTRGEIIGAVGMTGLATGPHLHFSLFDSGKYIDPLKSNLPSLHPDFLKLPSGYLQTTLTTLNRAHDTIVMAQNSATSSGSTTRG